MCWDYWHKSEQLEVLPKRWLGFGVDREDLGILNRSVTEFLVLKEELEGN